MYIIIHKYQRWPVNAETKQKYLKNMPKEKPKQHIKIWFVGQRGPKNQFQFVSLGGARLQIKPLS